MRALTVIALIVTLQRVFGVRATSGAIAHLRCRFSAGLSHE